VKLTTNSLESVSKAMDVVGIAWLHQGDVKYRLTTAFGGYANQ